MKKMWKRFVSLLLACTLLAGMLPLSASAQVMAPTDNKWVLAKVAALNDELGDEEHPYKLDGWAPIPESDLFVGFYTRSYFTTEEGKVSTTVMFIAPGNGGSAFTMPNYSGVGELWADSGSVALHIADGVTGIGSHAFNGMDTLEKVVFQDASKLTYVGSYAFNGDNKAQFTDEGNSGAAGDDPTRILDLSHVEKMGENAFYNCDGIKGVELSGNITAVETKEGGGTEEINHKIPNHAFESCNALTSITVPEGITTIGTAAFAGCTQASSITLPDSLVTIEDRAFMCSIDGANRSLTSLTIPENVETIGASAFYGYKALATVTVESTVLEEPGDAAFGNSAVNAYATTTTITDAESGITYEDVTVGTQFYTPSNAIKELFENEYNCYLGDLTPLEYANTVKATCEKNGYHVYRMTITDIENAEGQHPTVESRVTIPAVGHNYEDAPDRDATCTLPGYHVQVCTNKKNGLVVTCEAPEKLTPIEDEPRLRHSYRNISVENPGIAADNTGNTVVTYTCANYSENEEENHHDGELSPSYSWEIQATTLTASTTQTLGNLTLPAATGKGNSIAAELTWADGVDTEELLGAGTHDVQVKLKITGAPNQFADYLDEEFTIRVQVEREALDFSKVEFQNATRYVGRENGEFEVIGMPTDTEITTIEFRGNDGKTWGTQAPAEDDADDQGKYLVRVTFIYEDDKYLISDDSALQPGEEYTLEAGTTGTGTITGTYEVRSLTAADLKATTINGLVYDAKEKATVRVEGLPKDAEVKVTWTENEVSKSEEYTATTPALEVAKITNAGEYDVRITVTHGSFDGGSATVTAKGVIAKQTVETPVANSGLTPYKPTVEQTGVPDSGDENIYTITGNKAIDAGTHTATATLVDKNNYKWSKGDEQETGTVTIPFTILKHSLQKPALSQNRYVFDGTKKAPLTNLNDELTYTYDTDGKLSATWTNYSNFVAYTATNAQKTDAETYKVTVALSNTKNYQWADGGTDSYDLTWSITPMQVTAPTVTVTSPVTYDGQSYNSEGTEITFGNHSGNSEGILQLGSEHQYYGLSSGGTALQEAPTNAGTYYVQVDFDFKGGLNPENYTITGNNRRQFTIEKAELTLTEPENEVLTASFTGQNMPIPAPGVSGLQKEGDEYTLTYTYTFTPAGSEEAQSPVESSKAPEVSAAGIYEVTVTVPDTCQNYWAEKEVTYTFRITSATQRVKLESSTDGWNAEQSTVSKTLGDEPFTVTGKGYVNDVVVNEDDIGYEVTGGDTQNPVVKVDPTSGEVTLLRAGSATITVTAAGSANYGEATATYTITVDKGTPEVAVQMPESGGAGNTYPYTGKELSFTAAVIGAGNGAVDPTTDEKVTYNFYSDDSGKKGGKIDSQPTKIGTYWVEAVYEGDDNYNEATSTAEKFTISPAALKVEATGHTDTYDGQPHDPAAITVKGVGGAPFEKDDYTVSYIEKGSDGEAKPDVDDLKWDSTLQVKDVAHSGDYWIKVVINGDDSSYDPYIGSVTVDIDPRPLTVTKDVTPTKVYDGTADATKNVEINSIDTGIEGETVTANLISAVYNSANANVDNFITITYELAEDPGTDTDLANYSLDGEAVTGAEMSEKVTEVNDTPVGITPASITVDIKDHEKVYDGQSLSIENPVQDTYWSTNDTIYSQNGVTDNLDITLSIASGSKDAGTYAITGDWTNKNYAVTFTGSWTGGTAGTYTIDHRPISVQIGNAEGFYGDAPDLTLETKVILTPETAQGENAGLVEGENIYDALEDLSLSSDATVSSPVREDYTIYPLNNGVVDQDKKGVYGNYDVTFTQEGTYTVKPRPITITIADHSSVYGDEIDGGIAHPVSGTDYQVSLTEPAYTGSGESAIVNNDALTVTLETTASAKAAAGTYDITGSAAGEKVNNYAITWAGNGTAIPEKPRQNYGKYTIDKAGLKVEFDHHDKVLNGVSINITDSYNANPLVLENASTSVAVSKADKATLDITYSIGTAGGGTGDVSQIAEINETTGEVTILKTGTVRITATVTPQGNSNYTGQVTTWYELNIIGGGQMALKVTPKTNLAYTGDPQALLESASCSLEGATIKYSLDNQDWQNTIPKGTNAGTYTVYVKATDPNSQYSDVTEHVTVTIDKADLEGTFKHGEKYTHVLVDGNSYDSATANELTISSAGYDAKPAKYTYRSADTTVAMAENGGSTIRIMGSAGQETTITVTVPGDNNYNEGTFTYTLEISDNLSEIVYSVENKEVTYNGQPQTIEVKVTAPASGATVMYWNEETKEYDLSEPPAYTDVKDSGTTIKFQITAPGYEIEEGTATLTINPKDISQCQVEGIAASYTFVNKPIEPQTVEVVDGSVILTKNTDYTLEYGANQEVGEDTGTVTIKGKGNYTGKVTEYFDIIPVDGSSGITASIAPNFGTYDPDAPVTAEVTVTHQTGSDSHKVDLTAANAKYTISATDLVTGQAITDHGATGTGGTLTFTKPAIYDITLTLTGDHQGEFRLSYTLLPLSNDDGGLTLTVDDETQKVFTYGGEIDPSDATIKVTANNTDVTDQCTLTYVYTPFEGTPTTTASPYTAEVLENAGVYTVTATPTDGSAITGTGTFTFLILQRDLSEANLTVEDSGLVYNQKAQMPSVTVAANGDPVQGTDYTITYYNNVNASDAAKAVVTATGNNFTGSKTAEFTIAPKPITDCVVENIPDQFYTGEPVIPPVTIKDSSYTLSYTLILGYDYTTACADKGPGEATVTITGTGNYTGEVEKTFTIKSEGAPEPSERFDLVVTPSQWTWEDDLTNLRLSVTFGTDKELTLGTEYTLEVNGQTFDGTTGKTKDNALTYIKGLKPGKYTITATGMDAYAGSTDTETVTIQKIQPTVTVKATPNSLSGGGKVTLTLKGEKLPNGTDLKTRLSVTAKNDNDVTLEDLHIQWPEDGSLTAELTLPNTNETYTFALRFAGDEYYEPASSDAMVVVGQQTSGGGGGSDPGDQPANPDDTGVSDWLNTKEHLAYLAGYPGGIFGPDQNMTRAEAAQMFYNLLLEKDVEITVEFVDVPEDAWYATPVNTLASLGILSGVGNGRFDPERSITRAEFTVIAMKFANTSGGGVNIFSDVNEDDWFYSAVVDSTQYGWINGYPDGTFRPEATISRAEVTVIVNHMLGRAADRPYVIAHEEELNTFGDVNRGHWGYFHVAEATNAHEYHTKDGTESWTGLS